MIYEKYCFFFYSKDMWSASEGSSDDRSGVAGLAYLSGICQNYRYSINEESSDFSSIGIVAHEIGHK